MHDFELEQLRRNPTWAATLRSYWERQQQVRQEPSSQDRWITRLAEIPGVDTTKLSSIHGRLIAYGFLKFDLSDRDVGMRYQLTPLAVQALGHASTTSWAELAESA